MTDETTPAPPARIVINPSALRALLITGLTSIALVVSTLTTIAAFVSNRDLAGLIVWIKSDDFISFCGAVSVVASLAVIVWRSLSRLWVLVRLGRAVDDKVAIVKGPTPPPSIDAIMPAQDTPPAP